MGALPWDKWFYHTDLKLAQVNSIHQQAVNLEDTTQADLLHLNEKLDNLRKLVTGNYALLYMQTVIVMPDLQLADYQVKLQALPPPPDANVPAEIGSLISETIAGGLLGKIMWNMVKNPVKAGAKAAAATVKDFFSSGSKSAATLAEPLMEGAEEAGMSLNPAIEMSTLGEGAGRSAVTGLTEEVGEGVGEASAKVIFGDMTAGALTATGIGIFAAVGCDAIFGAVAGAGEAKQLNKQIGDMQTALNKVQLFATRVATKTNEMQAQVVTQETLFEKLVIDLATIKTPDFPYKYDETLDMMPQFMAAQQQALREYGLLVQLRNTYETALARNPRITKDAVISNVLMTAPPAVTYNDLAKYWNILAKYSNAMNKVA